MKFPLDLFKPHWQSFLTTTSLSFLYFANPLSINAQQLPPPRYQDVNLSANLAILHHPVTTNNIQAQRFFDQGLTLIYAFNHDAAFRSFKQAVELDPQMAMAYWGMALALGTNINFGGTPEKQREAYQYIQEALKLAPNVTDNERAYIEALSTRYSNDPNSDLKKLAVDYNEAMGKVRLQFPDDLDAATLFAESALDLNPWDQWTPDGKPRPGTEEIVQVLESVLKRDPQHLGANHYYIHAIEASKYPERALPSANRLRHMLPSSGHITHMPSHIYMLVGDYAAAADANEEAIMADKAYIRRYGLGGFYPIHYMSHNLDMLSRAYDMMGRFRDAIHAADELEAFYSPHFQEMPEIERYQSTPLFVLLRFHRWQDILHVPPPNPSMSMSTAIWHFARAMAYASLGQDKLAQDEQSFFQEAANQLPAGTIFGNNPAAQIMLIAQHLLNAKLAEAQQNLPSAIQSLQQAIAIQDNLRYDEPADWFYPIRESLGGALLRNQQPKEAEKVFREDLDQHPRNGRSLFGLLKALEAQERAADAFWIRSEFERAWRYSDTPLNINSL